MRILCLSQWTEYYFYVVVCTELVGLIAFTVSFKMRILNVFNYLLG